MGNGKVVYPNVFDVLTCAAVVDELQTRVLDGRIQRIGLIDPLTVGAEIYARGRRQGWIASADPRRARVLLLDAMPSVDPNLITPFGLLARKYLRGAILTGIEQPPLERILRFSIAKRLPPLKDDRARAADGTDQVDDEVEDQDLAIYASDEEVHRMTLIVEIMGRHSNIILVGPDGFIMESVKRVTPRMSRVRPVLPKHPYTPPPAQERPDPRHLTSAGAEALLTGAPPDAPLADRLVRGLRGVSPQIAREIAFRTGGGIDALAGAVAPADLARETRALFEPLLTGDWHPCLYRRGGELVDYAAIPMLHLAESADAVALASISDAVRMTDEEQSGAPAPQDHAQRRDRLIARARAAQAKIDRRLHSLRAQAGRAEAMEELKRRGELIYGYLWQIRPGQSELEVDGERIALDPTLSAKENAQRYFEEYRKAQKAGATTPERVAAAEAERGYLDQLITQISQADGFAALEGLRDELEAFLGRDEPGAGQPKRASAKQTSRRPQALVDAHGNAIYIGRSGRENDQVTFAVAGADDTWLHARGVPGAHVIIRWRQPGDENEETIETAAALAGWYSAARESGTVDVDVTQRRHVRKIKGAGPGMVTYRQERTIAVPARDEAMLRQDGRLG